MSEAAIGGVLYKKVFSEICQNSQENTCARVSFSITWQPIEKETLPQLFSCESCQISKNTSRRLLRQYVKIWFWDQFFFKKNLLRKALNPPLIGSPFFWLKTFFSMKKNINYSSSLPYLIDANWLIGFIFRVKWLGKKSQL